MIIIVFLDLDFFSGQDVGSYRLLSTLALSDSVIYFLSYLSYSLEIASNITGVVIRLVTYLYIVRTTQLLS